MYRPSTTAFNHVLITIVIDVVTPYVPAADWVTIDGTRLRVEYDDVVQFSDLVVASGSRELVSKIPSKECNDQVTDDDFCITRAFVPGGIDFYLLAV